MFDGKEFLGNAVVQSNGKKWSFYTPAHLCGRMNDSDHLASNVTFPEGGTTVSFEALDSSRLPSPA